MKEVERVFGMEGVDFLVVVREGGGKVVGVLRKVLDGMGKVGEGRVVTVYAGSDEGKENGLVSFL